MIIFLIRFQLPHLPPPFPIMLMVNSTASSIVSYTCSSTGCPSSHHRAQISPAAAAAVEEPAERGNVRPSQFLSDEVATKNNSSMITQVGALRNCEDDLRGTKVVHPAVAREDRKGYERRRS